MTDSKLSYQRQNKSSEFLLILLFSQVLAIPPSWTGSVFTPFSRSLIMTVNKNQPRKLALLIWQVLEKRTHLKVKKYLQLEVTKFLIDQRSFLATQCIFISLRRKNVDRENHKSQPHVVVCATHPYSALPLVITVQLILLFSL